MKGQGTLSLCWDECRDRWPGVVFPDQDRLVLELQHHGLSFSTSALGAEWWLTRAASHGDSVAQQTIDAWVVRLMRPWFARSRFPESLQDDVLQAIRHALFGVTMTPKLMEFEGKGPLDRWLQVVGIRVALNTMRLEQRHRGLELNEATELTAQGYDPELALLKTEHRLLLTQAFAAAAQSLTERSRFLLSMRFVHGVPVESLATMLNAHRVTVSNWLSEARAQLLSEIGRAIRASVPEPEALEAVVASQPDLSISRLLRLSGKNLATSSS